MARNDLRSVSCWRLLFLVCISSVDGRNPKLLSVTRSKEYGDFFELSLPNNSACDASSCELFGGFLFQEANEKSTASKCFCYCSSEVTKPTFYSHKFGAQGCVKDADVIEDPNSGDCDVFTNTKIDVFDLYTKGKTRITLHRHCEEIQISGWKFNVNSSWVASTSTTFRVSYERNRGKSPRTAFLFWDGKLQSRFDGLLIKVSIGCTHRGKLNTLCAIFKAQGTHKYREISSPLPRDNEPASSTVIPNKKDKNIQSNIIPTHSANSGQTPTEATTLQESRDFNLSPTGSYKKQSAIQTWLVVALSLAGSVFIAVVIISSCLFAKCRNNCRKQQRTVSRRYLAAAENSPSDARPVPALEDYEYVHYPCLVDDGNTQPIEPTGNIKYERSEDNKLIIWTQGHTAGTAPNSQAALNTAPRLPYQRLLTRMSSSSPDCSASMRRISQTTEEELPYQKLRKASRPVSEGCRYGIAAVESQLERDQQQKAYQSLSLQRNPTKSPTQSETGYMKMEGFSRPESTTEYDYADPVVLNKLFRLQRSSSEQATIEISMGDLTEETASNQQQQQQEEDQDGYERIEFPTPNLSTIGDYENIEKYDVEDDFSSVTRNDQRSEAGKMSLRTSTDDFTLECSGCLSGEYVEPEEYLVMGKRKSLIIMDNLQSTSSGSFSFDKIEEEEEEEEEEEPKYFVLESPEADEGEFKSKGDKTILCEETLNEETASNQQQQQQKEDQDGYEQVEFPTPNLSTIGDYENIEKYDVKDNFSDVTRNDQRSEAGKMSLKTSTDDLTLECSGCLSGEYVEPEEYVATGKRKNLIIMDNLQSTSSGSLSFDKIEEEEEEEEEEPKYFVLECPEADEEKPVDDS